jgi:hypothetical protein
VEGKNPSLEKEEEGAVWRLSLVGGEDDHSPTKVVLDTAGFLMEAAPVMERFP